MVCLRWQLCESGDERLGLAGAPGSGNGRQLHPARGQGHRPLLRVGWCPGHQRRAAAQPATSGAPPASSEAGCPQAGGHRASHPCCLGPDSGRLLRVTLCSKPQEVSQLAHLHSASRSTSTPKKLGDSGRWVPVGGAGPREGVVPRTGLDRTSGEADWSPLPRHRQQTAVPQASADGPSDRALGPTVMAALGTAGWRPVLGAAMPKGQSRGNGGLTGEVPGKEEEWPGGGEVSCPGEEEGHLCHTDKVKGPGRGRAAGTRCPQTVGEAPAPGTQHGHAAEASSSGRCDQAYPPPRPVRPQRRPDPQGPNPREVGLLGC